MKRFRSLVLVAALLLPALARAQQSPFAMTSANCQSSPVFGNMPFCFDLTTGGINFKGTGSSYLGAGRSWLTGGESATNSTSVADSFPLSGNASPSTTSSAEGSAVLTANSVATLKNLHCVLMTAAGVVTVAGGTNYVIAVNQNLAASALTCTIAAAASSCSDNTHTVTTAIGDQLDFTATPSGTPTALEAKCSVEMDM